MDSRTNKIALPPLPVIPEFVHIMDLPISLWFPLSVSTVTAIKSGLPHLLLPYQESLQDRVQHRAKYLE